VLPWLQLRGLEAFGAVEFAPAESCLDPSDPRTPGAQRVLGCYKGLDGQPVRPALMWLAGRGPLDLDERDDESLGRHRMALDPQCPTGTPLQQIPVR
jgi:hypothetical protein